MKKNDLANINQVDQRIKQLEKRKSDLIKAKQYRENNAARKARANRLIETGALAEKYFEIKNLSISEREELFKIFSDFVTANKPKNLRK
ncbi:hypothetical protein [Terribacillus saccharophilus]|uniref:hypothetical protein n=1 Tax=Terribacillus saccharophilus TaxID=361277 RepID=UPI002989F8FB|nr:hypothetical protein [Terribacillus saccharophilus]MCM3227568.1 hypothetical protein [Terribacillus saccharophilus]